MISVKCALSLIIIFFKLDFKSGANPDYYPPNNQYNYGISMFNGHTMYMTVGNY